MPRNDAASPVGCAPPARGRLRIEVRGHRQIAAVVRQRLAVARFVEGAHERSVRRLRGQAGHHRLGDDDLGKILHERAEPRDDLGEDVGRGCRGGKPLKQPERAHRQVGVDVDQRLPVFGIGEQRPVVRHADEHHLPDVGTGVAGRQDLLDQTAEHQTAAAVRDRIDLHRLSESSEPLDEIDGVVMGVSASVA